MTKPRTQHLFSKSHNSLQWEKRVQNGLKPLKIQAGILRLMNGKEIIVGSELNIYVDRQMPTSLSEAIKRCPGEVWGQTGRKCPEAI